MIALLLLFTAAMSMMFSASRRFTPGIGAIPRTSAVGMMSPGPVIHGQVSQRMLSPIGVGALNRGQSWAGFAVDAIEGNGVRRANVASMLLNNADPPIATAGGVGMFSDGQELDELFDVVAEPAALGLLGSSSVLRTGVTKQRGHVHRDGDWHRSIHVWVVIRDPMGAGNHQVLLQKRALTKDTNPGLWDVSVAGHIEAGGLPLETAVREAQEELGINALPESLSHLFTIAVESTGETPKHGPYTCREVQDVYLYELPAESSSLQFSTGEVEAVQSEPLYQILDILRRGDSKFVARDGRYVEALTAALSGFYTDMV